MLPGFEIPFFIQAIKILTSKQQKITNTLAAAQSIYTNSLNKNNQRTVWLTKIILFELQVQDN